MDINLLIRRITRAANSGRPITRGTILESLAIAQIELPLQELTRSGLFFHGGLQLAANGIAPDAALPTTTAKVALFNGEGDGGKTYWIDQLSFFLLSGTPAAGASLWACISNGKLATPVAAMATGFGVGPARGMPKTSNARWGTAVTLPAGTIWRQIGSSLQLAAANFGQGDQPFEIKGGLAIPPGYALGLAILSGAGTTPLYAHNAVWAETETDLE